VLAHVAGPPHGQLLLRLGSGASGVCATATALLQPMTTLRILNFPHRSCLERAIRHGGTTCPCEGTDLSRNSSPTYPDLGTLASPLGSISETGVWALCPGHKRTGHEDSKPATGQPAAGDFYPTACQAQGSLNRLVRDVLVLDIELADRRRLSGRMFWSVSASAWGRRTTDLPT
jgi:hypothetical protein